MSDRHEEEWRWLVSALDDWSSAAEVAPGRLEVVVPGSDRRVVVVMTPEEWSGDLAGVAFGGLRHALGYVEEVLVGLGPEDRYAVYRQYELVPSPTPSLPEEEEVTPQPGGAWVVLDDEGRVVSRLAEWRDPGEGA